MTSPYSDHMCRVGHGWLHLMHLSTWCPRGEATPGHLMENLSPGCMYFRPPPRAKSDDLIRNGRKYFFGPQDSELEFLPQVGTFDSNILLRQNPRGLLPLHAPTPGRHVDWCIRDPVINYRCPLWQFYGSSGLEGPPRTSGLAKLEDLRNGGPPSTWTLRP